MTFEEAKKIALSKGCTEKAINAAIEEEYSPEDIARGYGIFSSDYGNGAEHIERYDVLMMYNTDSEAAEQAEKDGIKLIKDWEFSEENTANYIDTPENRKLLKPLALNI